MNPVRSPQVRVSDDPAGDAARRIAARLRFAVRSRGIASLALSGGSTAPAMIAVLVSLDVPWSAVGVWQVDERIVADGDPNRNAGQLGALPCEVHLMPVTSNDRRRAADAYASTLPDRFDVVHLGLGDDGHTASWPPADLSVARSVRHVELSSFNRFDRMTLTRRVVNGARGRIVLAVGASKRPMLERWLLGDGTLPISLVARSRTIAFVDEAARPHPNVRLSSVSPDASHL